MFFLGEDRGGRGVFLMNKYLYDMRSRAKSGNRSHTVRLNFE